MKILLHICCANCAIYPVKVLRQQGHHLSGYFFNHNIHPYQEFERRLTTVKDFAAKVDMEVTYRENYLLEDFLSAVAQNPGGRCEYCYVSRLEKTACHAAEGGYEGFSTSLLYSRYQQHDQIRMTGEALAQRHGIPFIYQDFRVGWREGIERSKEMGLYRQQYCGCIYSEKDRYCPTARG
mgnify:CR=1 FL=1